MSGTAVEVLASASGGTAPIRLVLPVVSQHDEAIEQNNPQSIRINKHNGSLLVRTYAPHKFAGDLRERTFNLVPGFECLPLEVTIQPGEEVRVQFSKADGKTLAD